MSAGPECGSLDFIPVTLALPLPLLWQFLTHPPSLNPKPWPLTFEYMGLRATVLLPLHFTFMSLLRVTPGRNWGTIYSVEDGAHISRVQGKHFNPCTVFPALLLCFQYQ